MYTSLHVCGVELVGRFHDRISGMPSIWSRALILLISQALDLSQTGQEGLYDKDAHTSALHAYNIKYILHKYP